MARIKPRKIYYTDYSHMWEKVYKPEILKYYSPPIELIAEALGSSVSKVQEQLRSGAYNYGIARKCEGDTYRYEFNSLRFIAWVEGKMS
jgi:hypothetical protein